MIYGRNIKIGLLISTFILLNIHIVILDTRDDNDVLQMVTSSITRMMICLLLLTQQKQLLLFVVTNVGLRLRTMS